MTARVSAPSTAGTIGQPALFSAGGAAASPRRVRPAGSGALSAITLTLPRGVRARRPLLQSLFDLGVDADTPISLAVALRASNGVIVAMTIVSVLAAIETIADARSLPLALFCLVLALVYSACLVLGAAGQATSARWVFLGAASIHYLVFNVAAGHAAGAPFWIVPFVAY